MAVAIDVNNKSNRLYLTEMYFRKINEGHVAATADPYASKGGSDSTYPSIVSILHEIDNVNTEKEKNKDNKTKEGDNSIQNKKYSLKVDTEENKLTKDQESYFKDSKIRDDEGKLKVMFPGTGRADRVGV